MNRAQTTETPCIRHCAHVYAPSQIDELNDRFVEARDEIEYAQEDAETTYFNESHKLAKDSVGVVTNLYQQILTDLSEADRGKLQRSMGMKMEQLKVRKLHCMLMSCLGGSLSWHFGVDRCCMLVISAPDVAC